MKNIKHYVIIGVELVILGMIGVNASTNIPSHGVSYTNSSSKENISTVEAALNELYNGFKVGTATSAQILSGKTALVQGQTLTGTMANKSGVSQVGNSFSVSETGEISSDDYAATGSVKIPVAGYYDTGSTLTFDLTDNNKLHYTNFSETISEINWGTNLGNNTGEKYRIMPKDMINGIIIIQTHSSSSNNGWTSSSSTINNVSTTSGTLRKIINPQYYPPDAYYIECYYANNIEADSIITFNSSGVTSSGYSNYIGFLWLD